MKKFLAIFLAMLCISSVLGVSVFAGNIIEDLSSELADDPLLYCITYQKETLSQVSMMYKPNPSCSFSGPGYVTVTKDTPIAVDHVFVCWKDKDGNQYFEGDKVYVDGEVTLYAVWEEKTDNDIRPIRVIKTALQTLQRLFQKFLGVFKDIQDFDANWNGGNFEHTTTEPLVTIPTTVGFED